MPSGTESLGVRKKSDVCEFWGYHNKAIEDSVLLGCDAASLREVVPQKGTWATKNVAQFDFPEDQT